MRKNRGFIITLSLIVLLAAVVFGGRYYLSAGRGGPSVQAPGPAVHSAETAPEKSCLYRAVVSPASREAAAERLAAIGGGLGDAMGDGTCLVRVPAGKEAEATRILGAELRPFIPEERLALALRTSAGGETPAPADAEGQAVAASITVNIMAFAPADCATLAQTIAAAGGEVLSGLQDEDSRILRAAIPRARLDELAASPLVVYIEQYTPPVLLNDRAADVIGAAPLAVPGFAGLNALTGAGEIVAVADNGLEHGQVSKLSADFTNPEGVCPKVIMLKSWTAGSTADRDGHGTHVAGTIAGNGTASGGRFRGIAPNARLYFQAIADRGGEPTPPPDLVSLFRPAYEGGARIHVNSWGGGRNAYGLNASQIDRFVFWYPDFLPVFGAGNDGPSDDTLTGEANAKNALVVGAAANPRPLLGTDSADAARVASFSSRGPADDGRIRPDLVVPGAGVISNRSPLAPAGEGEDPAYVARQGTSMAAAVAGGAAALLREEFKKTHGLQSPSAALIKAALINGARPLTGDTAAEGYGLVDLASTVLALEGRSFHFTEHRQGVGQGDEAAFTFEVESPDQPFSVTVAWTDPPAAPGARRALVNDLDLVVTGPDGETYYGNDAAGEGRRDERGNVERVRLERPQSGVYHISVHGTRITEAAVYSTETAQDFALVCGQAPARSILTTALASGGQAVLENGGALGQTAAPPAVVGDGRAAADPGCIPAGADVYYMGAAEKPTSIRAVYRTWRENGVRRLGGAEGSILAPLRAELREGGRRVAAAAAPPLINGRAGEPAQLLNGSEITAVINPSTQTLWSISASYQAVEGILAAQDGPGGELRLLDGQTYHLAADADLSFHDRIVNGSWADLPYGASTHNTFDALLPGMAVQLVIAPSTGRVEQVMVSRRLALGALEWVAPDGANLTLETGATFGLFAGASICRDGQPAALSDLRPGDHLQAVLLPGNQAILALEAFSRVAYGQVLHVSADQGALYLNDIYGNFRSLELLSRTEVYRWGFAVGAGVLAPGQWVRGIIDPATGAVRRVDIAETAEEGKGCVATFEPSTFTLTLDDKSALQLSPRVRVTKDGQPVLLRDLKPGDDVRYTALTGLPSTGPVTAAITARSAPETPAPQLTARGLPMLDYMFLDGRTDADRVYLYRADGGRSTLDVEGGRFVASVERRPGEKTVRVVAVDSRTGGVAGVSVAFPVGIAEPARDADDVTGSWAAEAIHEARQRGLMVGYPDGRFRPEATVNRGELTSILVRLLGLHPDPDAAPAFVDAARIPAWVRPAVAAAARRGLVSGLPDGSFRAEAPVTRAEGAAILVAALDDMGFIPAETGDPLPVPPYDDWASVPRWAREAVTRAYAAGILTGRGGDAFMPAARLTRAEAAAILTRITAPARG